MAGPRVTRSVVLYCVAFTAAAIASRADSTVYEKIPLGAIFEQGSDEVQTAFKLAAFKHNQNNTERRFELQAYVDVIKTADAFKLSKLSSGMGETVFLPRIPLIPSDYDFQFKRLQFPVKLCFAMTINKAQGQSLKVAGVSHMANYT